MDIKSVMYINILIVGFGLGLIYSFSPIFQEGLIRTGARLRDLDVREMKASG